VSAPAVAALTLNVLALAWSPLTPDAEAQSPIRARSTTVRVQSPVRAVRTAPPPQTVRTVEPDGTMVIAYPDGRKRYWLRDGGTRYLSATGNPIQVLGVMEHVQALDPPPPPGEKSAKWLERHAKDLLDAMMSVVTGDQNATRASYLKRESSTLTVYQKIDGRTKDLARLVAP